MKFHAIKENHLFVKAYRGGKKAACGDFVLYVLQDKHANLLKKQNPQKQKINRIGISTSKKIGNAVKRSRARRVLREGLRWAMAEREIKTGYLIVIVAKERSTVTKSTLIGKEMIHALEKLEMYR